MLDVGCGLGEIGRALELIENIRYHGIDISFYAAKFAKHTVASAIALPFRGGSFEAVIASELIEHLSLANVRVFLAESNRVLKTCGYLFIFTPNWWDVVRLLAVGHPWHGYEDKTHVTFFNPISLIRLLESAGFLVTECFTGALGLRQGSVGSLLTGIMGHFFKHVYPFKLVGTGMTLVAVKQST